MALDRLGSRRLILAGAVTMAAGQLVLALAEDVPTAVAARVLVGAGDAMTFISVLRVVSFWFAGPVIPLITQLTGILGQLGSVLAAYPLVALLHGTSWEATFLGAAAMGVLVAVLVAVALRDAPGGPVRGPAVGLADLRATLLDTWREPGTRIGLYTHLVTQFSGTVFALLWGYPFLVVGQGLSPGDGGRAAHPPGPGGHGRRPAAGPAVRALAAAPVGAGLLDPGRHRDRRGRSCWPGRGARPCRCSSCSSSSWAPTARAR